MGRILNSGQTIEAPRVDESSSTRLDREWIVTVFNNDTNTYEEVITILMIATGCDSEEAYVEAWEIDHLGQSVVHCASQEECLRVRDIIATIGIVVTAEKDL